MERAKLIEPGVSYFLEETLKKCHEEKWKFNNTVMNVILFILIVFIFWFVFYYLKNSKNLTEKEKKEKEDLKKTYFLDKIKQMSDKANKEFNLSITNLPKFENDFVHYDKKFI